MELVDMFGLLQRIATHLHPIATPMHHSGHKLDLIISRSSNYNNIFLIIVLLNVNDLLLVLIYWLEKFLIGSSNRFIWIILDRTLHHLFCVIYSQGTSLEELAQCYDTTLSQILDKHAPVNTKIL